MNNLLILEYMHEQGVLFTLGDDAHGPEDVGMHYDKLLSYIDSIGIKIVYALDHSTKRRAISVSTMHK